MSSTSRPSIAIIGGGISGLVCAIRLGQLGFSKVTVFDTGKRAAGGRCSSRKLMINGQLHTFDHSCQYFTVSDRRFAKIVSFLHNKNAVKIWTGKIGHLKSGKFQEDPSLTQAFIGTDGMQSIADCLASNADVQRPVWVSEVCWEEGSKKWKVDRFGFYDYLVIAHNGKCADKLMSSAGAPQVHSLLRVRFNDVLNPRDQRMHLCSLWVLLVAFKTSLKLKYDGAHVDHEDISWISNNTSKYRLTKETLSTKKDSAECWTIISTKSFGKAFKVSQENIPPSTEKMVTEKLFSAFKTVIARYELPSLCYTGVQLWGAAVPINTLNNGSDCVFDGRCHVGVCGDWLSSPCIQGAAISGLSLAEKIQQSSLGQFAVNTSLQATFKATSSSAIGSFPTDKSLIFSPQS
ncbi:uncharacterized protein LOC134235697 isoform X2 [Saccostrea cucullata]|uniref:uncharacterized protein LOC134235697 isoform X2 n=1 Tax=Saccostrea cuccullata TaxID=36930 RepID=UPI002ED3638C